jgi:hypothetical protein
MLQTLDRLFAAVNGAPAPAVMSLVVGAWIERPAHALRRALDAQQESRWSEPIYGAWCALTLYSTAVGVVWYAFACGAWRLALAILVAYARQQLLFVAVHVPLHARFVGDYATLARGDPNSERFVGSGTFLAFLHHFYRADAFRRWWLPYRLSYLAVGPLAFLAAIAALDFALVSACRAGTEDGRAVTATAIYVALANAAFMNAWWHTQALVHEWYHVPPSERRAYFSFAVYDYLAALERIGVADTVLHRQHHRNDSHALLKASDFFDTWAPASANAAVDRAWRDMVRDLGWTDEPHACVIAATAFADPRPFSAEYDRAIAYLLRQWVPQMAAFTLLSALVVGVAFH